ncbi:MOSC domain-containing protein [Elioraea rosea]|uniref:MOSC domain-containing protein n=1 Tax=Elioraea rosea TaxID=2492390 RepID=UPI001187080E|nr:MOSC domain-containing protein [Elioraea rosea]
MQPTILAVASGPGHAFSKQAAAEILLLAGLGVAGDAHAGETVKHRSRVARDPTQPNLRQVHLLHAELFEELAPLCFALKPGDIGENVTTRGLDLLALPAGTILRLGASATVALTGLRNPCYQLDDFAKGLMKATLGRAADGSLIRKAGVMAVVREGGVVRPGDAITVTRPDGPQVPLAPV